MPMAIMALPRPGPSTAARARARMKNGNDWSASTGRINLTDRLYFRKLLETCVLAAGDYQIGRVTGKNSVNFGYPVPDAAGNVEVVVFIALDLSAWLYLLTGMPLS